MAEHGTWYRYAKEKCRCDLCRAGNASRQKMYRSEKRTDTKALTGDMEKLSHVPADTFVSLPPADTEIVHAACNALDKEQKATILALQNEIADLKFRLHGPMDFEEEEEDPTAPRTRCKTCFVGPLTAKELRIHRDAFHSGDNQALEVDR